MVTCYLLKDKVCTGVDVIESKFGLGAAVIPVKCWRMARSDRHQSVGYGFATDGEQLSCLAPSFLFLLQIMLVCRFDYVVVAW